MNMVKKSKLAKAHVITVDMGYGHQRASYPLKDIAYNKTILNANTYKGIPKSDRDIWKNSRKAYEFISRFKKVPIIGSTAFDIYDKLQAIEPFYPKRDLSAANIQIKSMYSLIKRKKWGKHLIDKLAQKPLPLITTFFIPAFMAETFNYPGEIYCLGTDTDLSRSWAPLNPNMSRIKYFSPNYRVAERLKMYGVNPDNIFITGFPLPDEIVGGEKETILKKDLGRRLYNLDPKKKYTSRYKETIISHLGKKNFATKQHHPLTLAFAVGGAGAQRELGMEIVKSLKRNIQKKQIKIILVAGTHSDVNTYFKKETMDLGLGNQLGKGIEIIFERKKEDYFKKFTMALKQTDIIWTKPSELSFYTALGIPLIMSETIGSQEKFNRRWLKAIGSGIDQENPQHANQWLFDWLNSGWFAEAAMQGFIEASTNAVDNIKKVVIHKPELSHDIQKILQY